MSVVKSTRSAIYCNSKLRALSMKPKLLNGEIFLLTILRFRIAEANTIVGAPQRLYNRKDQSSDLIAGQNLPI